MKKIDDELGGTTPLNVILNFPTKNKKINQMMMSLMSGKKITTQMRIKQNIGLLEIKWIKSLKFTII